MCFIIFIAPDSIRTSFTIWVKAMKKLLIIIASVVFLISTIIALRQPISLVFLFGIAAIAIHYVNKLGKELTLIIIILGSVGVLFYVNSMVPLWGERYESYKSLREINEREREKRYTELNAISSAKDRVKSSLKDPSSANFSGEYISSDGAICGYVNAKNSYGAYSGSQRYINLLGVTQIDDGSPEFSSNWGNVCKK